jgi:DNA-directed DNA polymerase III PolC
MFIHLRTHSAYSLQEGLLQPEEIARAAATNGMPAVGLTDHRLLTGSVEFVTAAKQAGVQPILGMEIDLESGPLSLLAMSMEGWSNLCRLSSALALQDAQKDLSTLELLEKYSRDLIALSGAHGLENLKTIFPDRLYLELQRPSNAVHLLERADKLGLPTVITHPVYYLTAQQAPLQKTLSAIRLNLPIDQLRADAAAPNGSYFASAQEMEARFKDFPEALAATQEIASRCKFDLPLGVPRMPAVPLPNGMTAAQVLRGKAERGAHELYGKITPAIQSRLDHELEVITRMGFEPVFLIVEELLDFARRTAVPFSSRGSAASSLVAHCLKITSPDPLRLDLYFERFLNPARITPPDIDTDLCSRRRDSVIQHVFDVYGADRVAMVGTINRFRSRSALGEVAKAYGLRPQEVRELVNRLPHWYWSRAAEGDDQDDPASPFEELRALYASQSHQYIFKDAEALLKLPRHLSVHAGGVIVAPAPLTDFVPVMRSGSKGLIITQFDLDSVEALGLVKIDLLGIRGLTVLGDVAEFIARGRPQQYINLHSVLDATPADDPGTSERVQNGQTIGCFQIESPGMRSTLREIHARSEHDIMAALALYRPGPLTGGLKDAFVRRFKGEEKVSHLHASLAPLLDETFGVILYQEQVLRIAHELAGFSLAEADLLRRAMSHFDPGKRMQELERKFIGQAESKNGIAPAVGKRVWEMMAAFAGYGFPKAHAASYAKVAWRSAWCKTHFPAEFMAAVLANWGGYYSQRVYISEARRIGLAVRPPQVNHPAHHFSVHKNDDGQKVLYMGLDQIKELTRRTIEQIIRYAPFHSMEDFLARVDPRVSEAENLARVGAMSGFGTIPAILRRLRNGNWQKDQMSLFEWNDNGGEDWTLEQKVSAQQELLGAGLEAHPLELVAEKIAASGAITTVDAVGLIGRRVTVAGVRQTSHGSRTAKGELMMFLSIEDLAGMLDVILFPDVYRAAKSLLDSAAPLLITGVIEFDAARGEPFLRAEKIASLRS